ncbi:hypothetical protein NQ315_014718, partial [Exocentrus adspersus]
VVQNVKATFPNILTLLQIYLTIPISNASGERSFSALKRIKTYLRSNLGQDNLDALLLLYIENDELRIILRELSKCILAQISDHINVFMVQGIINNFLEKDLHFQLKGRDMVIKWEHIKSFYYLDTAEEDRICPKLTDKHILKGSMNKMKVSTCMQLFSNQVGSLMKRIAMWDMPDRTGLHVSATDTAELILFLYALFDSLNSNSKVAPSTKPLKEGITENSEHENYWKMAVRVVQTMKFYSVETQRFVTVPSLKNLLHTLKAFIYLKHVLLSKFKFKFILSRFLNQDPLEHFFSYIRSHGVRNVPPGSTQFISSFKTLLINNFVSRHSPYSNCEEDFSGKLLTNMKSLLLNDIRVQETSLQQHLPQNMPQFVPLHKKTNIGKCTTTD